MWGRIYENEKEKEKEKAKFSKALMKPGTCSGPK
jgi:hypothetical protein